MGCTASMIAGTRRQEISEAVKEAIGLATSTLDLAASATIIRECEAELCWLRVSSNEPPSPGMRVSILIAFDVLACLHSFKYLKQNCTALLMFSHYTPPPELRSYLSPLRAELVADFLSKLPARVVLLGRRLGTLERKEIQVVVLALMAHMSHLPPDKLRPLYDVATNLCVRARDIWNLVSDSLSCGSVDAP